jgi:hypothetical protein
MGMRMAEDKWLLWQVITQPLGRDTQHRMQRRPRVPQALTPYQTNYLVSLRNFLEFWSKL